MFLLAERKVIRGCREHQLAGLGCGTDYHYYYRPIYTPFRSRISIPYPRYRWTWRGYREGDGGAWIRYTRLDNGDRIEVAHLSKYLVTPSNQIVEAGTVVCISGNSGALTSGPHAHVQIFDRYGRRLNPETYDWGTEGSLQSVSIPELFASIWKRPGATGEIQVFETERREGKYKTYQDLVNTMTYWFQQVHPTGDPRKVDKKGDAKWQRKKEKVLLR